MNYTRKTAPTVQPIDMALAKLQCLIDADSTSQESLLSLYIDAAVNWVESYTGRSLMTQTWQVSARGFASRLWLPRAAPLASITFVKYYDASNVLQTLSASVYTAPAFTEPTCVKLAYAQVWPVVYDRDDAVQIEYITGVSDPEAVPAALRQAVQLLVGHYFANREEVVIGTISARVPMAAEALCAPYRLFLRNPEWEAA